MQKMLGRRPTFLFSIKNSLPPPSSPSGKTTSESDYASSCFPCFHCALTQHPERSSPVVPVPVLRAIVHLFPMLSLYAIIIIHLRHQAHPAAVVSDFPKHDPFLCLQQQNRIQSQKNFPSRHVFPARRKNKISERNIH